MTDRPSAALAWWQSLQPDLEHGKSGDRAALAKLRRCASVAEAMNQPAAIDLFRRCQADRSSDLPAIALTAAILAHVRTHTPGTPVARHIGPDAPDAPAETALLKPLRFQRLMQASDPDERLVVFRRLVMLAKGKLDVLDLARATLDWSERRRRRWTYDYWSAGPAEPAAAPPAA